AESCRNWRRLFIREILDEVMEEEPGERSGGAEGTGRRERRMSGLPNPLLMPILLTFLGVSVLASQTTRNTPQQVRMPSLSALLKWELTLMWVRLTDAPSLGVDR